MVEMFLMYFRYQFFLQVKRDILQGRLPVSFETGAELAALAVQCEYSIHSFSIIFVTGAVWFCY